ncbi:hypothetical protein AMECASPLE_038129 [Ameca splendens]|uniref:Uncharacterized protein n=1 Tax=Ameca splendens TaxID=208324 RepID=A0ABV0YV75_9TELE
MLKEEEELGNKSRSSNRSTMASSANQGLKTSQLLTQTAPLWRTQYVTTTKVKLHSTTMGPKKNPALEDFEEIRKVLDFPSGETSTIRLQQKYILDLVEEVKALRLLNEEKDKRIAVLENRVADLEQYTRMNEVIITGLCVRPHSYAGAVAGPCPAGPRRNRWPLSSCPRG